MGDHAIEVRGISKRFRLGASPIGRGAYSRLGEDLVTLLTRPWRRRDEASVLWALRDVTFDVDHGEIVGLIGGNGAGKSTLLKVLARVTEPTEGEAALTGRVGSLLEVGTGFHMELTGRENIYMAGAILGMRRAEIRRRFDEIVAFSELERFLDTPVKRYSSGMFVRLAFAVAAHLEAEILLIDEVLAVGDASFQQKCLGKISDVARTGRTVVFVSHSMDAVERLCTRAILLEAGRVSSDGTAATVCRDYLRRQSAPAEGTARREFSPQRLGSHGVRLVAVTLRASDGERRADFRRDEPVVVELEYDLDRALHGLGFTLSVSADGEPPAFAVSDAASRPVSEGPGRYTSRCMIPARLLNTRRYVVEVEAEIRGSERAVLRERAIELVVSSDPGEGARPGAVAPDVVWEIEQRPLDAPASRPDEAVSVTVGR